MLRYRGRGVSNQLSSPGSEEDLPTEPGRALKLGLAHNTQIQSFIALVSPTVTLIRSR